MKHECEKWEQMHEDAAKQQKRADTIAFILIMLLILSVALTVSWVGVAHSAEVNPAVTQNTLADTACSANWTKTIRPTSTYTQAWEKQVGGGKDTVVDHVIPLCAGGHPTDYKNYQLQKTATSYRKDTVEKHVCALLCSGRITLKEAQGLFYDE